MKSGSRTIGDKLARQIEVGCDQTKGWMDVPHNAAVQPDAPVANKPVDLLAFLTLAEHPYTVAPKSRPQLLKNVTDVLNRRAKKIA